MGAKTQGESGSGKKRDMRKVKGFACKRMGHYGRQCPNRKKRSRCKTNKMDEVEFQAQFERECAFLICCTSVETKPNIWYIENGASSHMTGVRENFNDLIYTEVQMHISLGYDTLFIVVGCGIVTFQRDSLPPISFRDVL